VMHASLFPSPPKDGACLEGRNPLMISQFATNTFCQGHRMDPAGDLRSLQTQHQLKVAEIIPPLLGASIGYQPQVKSKPS
jgi:hypothetical protein